MKATYRATERVEQGSKFCKAMSTTPQLRNGTKCFTARWTYLNMQERNKHNIHKSLWEKNKVSDNLIEISKRQMKKDMKKKLKMFVKPT